MNKNPDLMRLPGRPVRKSG